jgi:hypothetical protein
MISAHGGHLEVVKALLEVGGRELLMLTRHKRASCLAIGCREACRSCCVTGAAHTHTHTHIHIHTHTYKSKRQHTQ